MLHLAKKSWIQL